MYLDILFSMPNPDEFESKKRHDSSQPKPSQKWSLTKVHGTSSLILPLLTRTNGKNGAMLMSIRDMLDHYGMVPLGGEVDRGVRCGPTDILDMLSYVSSAPLKDPRIPTKKKIEKYYDLNSILKSYTEFPLYSAESYLQKAKMHLSSSYQYGFEPFNNFLFYYARARQLGADELSINERTQLNQAVQNQIKWSYFILIVINHLYPDIDKIKRLKQQAYEKVKKKFTEESPEMIAQYEQFLKQMKDYGFEKDYENFTIAKYIEQTARGKRGELTRKLDSFFGSGALFERVCDSQIEFAAIFKDPTEETLQPVLSILKLDEAFEDETQFFTLIKPKEMIQDENVDYMLEDVMDAVYCSDKLSIMNVLNKMYFSFCDLSPLGQEVNDSICQRMQLIKDRVSVIDKIDAANVKFSDEEFALMQKQFPIILVCETDKFTIEYGDTFEYRSKEPLIFGQDITMMATDSTSHQLLLIRYLRENNIKGVEVILIDDLKESIKTEKRPTSQMVNPKGHYRFKFFTQMVVARHNEQNEEAQISFKKGSKPASGMAEAVDYIKTFSKK